MKKVEIKYVWFNINLTGTLSEVIDDYDEDTGTYSCVNGNYGYGFDAEVDATNALAEFITPKNQWKYGMFSLVKICRVDIR